MRNVISSLVLALLLLGSSVGAQTPAYHLERVPIQAHAFLESLPPAPAPGSEISATVEEQLAPSNSVWSRQLVVGDVESLIATARKIRLEMADGMTANDLSSAKTSLESLARRLRVSSAALTLSPQSRTALDFLLLELDESARVLGQERDQLQAHERQQRRARPVSIGVGVGLGGWGVPYGWGSYYPYGRAAGPGPYLPYPGYPMWGPRCW